VQILLSQKKKAHSEFFQKIHKLFFTMFSLIPFVDAYFFWYCSSQSFIGNRADGFCFVEDETCRN